VTVSRCCGEKDAYFAPPRRGGCSGIGTIECLCGGESCVCHNHGEVDCDGCSECDPTEVIEEDDLFCHHDEPYRPVSPPRGAPLK
jgi:hypothetical protein